MAQFYVFLWSKTKYQDNPQQPIFPVYIFCGKSEEFWVDIIWYTWATVNAFSVSLRATVTLEWPLSQF